MAYTVETVEYASYELLQTHYYKTSYDSLKSAIIEFLTNNGFQISEFNDDYGEAVAIKGKLSTTIKIITQNPRETSIDFFIEYYGFLGRKRAVFSFLEQVYHYLGQKFEFKGLGLHQ